MNDDKSLNPSTDHELEDVLRTLAPRAPELNVDLIFANVVERTPAIPTNVNARSAWLTFGGACVASAFIGAAITLSIVQSKIHNLQEQVATLTQQDDVASSDTQTGESIREPPQDDSQSPYVRPVANRFAASFPLLANDTLEQGLVVGSHLNRVAFQHSVDRPNANADAGTNHDSDTPGLAPDQPRPTTRAAIMADLLDT